MEKHRIILWSVLILGGIGAVLGLGLTYFSKLFNVERDPRIDDVFACLAGINCGGCGYAGCDAFAAALVKGEAKTENCRPTSAAKKEEINAILGAEGGDTEDTVAAVLCNGGNNAKDKYSYQGYGNCRSSQMLAQGSKFCPVGCMGLKDCSVACGYNAADVSAETNYSVIKKHRCVSCGACVSACPKKLIVRIPRRAKYYVACSNHAAARELRSYCTAGCIGCGKCASA
ncbi:MAG: 4Fe-4S binding protein, partial [Clostridiales bacterium]|nr:4Fe-4S binding protein [Clostridiales bacterium]